MKSAMTPRRPASTAVRPEDAQGHCRLRRPLRKLRFVTGAAVAIIATAMPAGMGQAEVGRHPLEALGEALHYTSPSGILETRFGVQANLKVFGYDERPIGIIVNDPGQNILVEPRVTILGDLFLGDRFYAFTKVRYDRGYDPGVHLIERLRADEWYGRLTVIPAHLDVQVGKFGTVFGNWVGRHDPWKDPFISPPLPYDQVVSVSDQNTPPSAAEFAARREVNDLNASWVPIFWGPVYAHGAAIFGSVQNWQGAVAVSNSGPSERPYFWPEFDFSRPTVTARVAWLPDPAWTAGLSGSYGPYLFNKPALNLPPGKGLADPSQIVVGADLAWEHHRWRTSAELMLNRFEVVNAGNADSLSWYAQARYQVDARLHAAARFGQIFHAELDSIDQRWDYDVHRAEAALGYRLDRHLQLKLNYALQLEKGPTHGPHQVAFETILQF